MNERDNGEWVLGLIVLTTWGMMIVLGLAAAFWLVHSAGCAR
jgi:hypothetical protein